MHGEIHQKAAAWVKVQYFQNPELSNSDLKTCNMPTKYSQSEA